MDTVSLVTPIAFKKGKVVSAPPGGAVTFIDHEVGIGQTDATVTVPAAHIDGDIFIGSCSADDPFVCTAPAGCTAI